MLITLWLDEIRTIDLSKDDVVVGIMSPIAPIS